MREEPMRDKHNDSEGAELADRARGEHGDNAQDGIIGHDLQRVRRPGDA